MCIQPYVSAKKMLRVWIFFSALVGTYDKFNRERAEELLVEPEL